MYIKPEYLKDLQQEISHIFDSGANEIRVYNMVKTFLERRGDLFLKNTATYFKVGKRVQIVKCLYGHEFEIGQVVDINMYEFDPIYKAHWLCTDGTSSWWVAEEEARMCYH